MRATTPIAISLVAAMSLFGCSSDEGPGPDESEQEAPESSAETEPTPEDYAALAGSYELVSELDLASGGLIGGDLEKLLAGLQEAPIETLVLAGVEQLGLGEAVQAKIEEWLQGKIDPSFLDKAGDIAGMVEDALGDIDVVTQLVIDESGAATHSVVGVHVTVDGDTRFFELEGSSEAVELSFAGTDLGFGAHDLGLPVGLALSDVLDKELIDRLDPGATDVVDALSSLVDCAKLANGDSLIEIACEVGAERLSKELVKALDKLDAVEASVSLSGAATVSDSDANGSFDSVEGTWAIDGEDVPFTGARM